MHIISANQLKKGYKAKSSTSTSMGTYMMPPQFVPDADKDLSFVTRTMDNIEYEGMRQVRQKANRLLKNYKMANGELDITDFVKTGGQYSDIVSNSLGNGGEMPNSLQYHSLLDTLVNVLCNEFANRYNNIEFVMTDPDSDNELWAAKKEQVDQVLLAKAYQKQYHRLGQCYQAV